ncbi:MAG: phosphoribosylglycinamide formyltransferase [SAR324 cluster bacterium]|nr:phosphoribosylglycinamide formyltransferase [SAR324 cluster bacterium]
MTSRLPIGVLVSGSGTNLQSIIDQKEAGELSVEIKVVISNVKDAYAIQRAEIHGIEVKYISHKSFSSREAFDTELTNILESYGVQLVVLAGFMRLLSADFVSHWMFRLINIHPSLLPAFPGLNAQRQAFEHGVKVTGCSVFFVDEGVDTGPIIIQASVPVLSDDTPERLASRILQEEHRILPLAIQWIADEAIRIEGRRVNTPHDPQ